jgi:hypothetical protein
MWTVKFWKSAVERAIRTVAQVLLSLIVVGETGFLDVDWMQAASVAGLSGLASILMSIVATGIGDHESSSFVKGEE